MVRHFSRRAFLAASLPLLASPQVVLAKTPARQVFDYSVDVGVLFDLITFALKGTIVMEIDQAAGRYRITVKGEGDSISLDTDARGMIRQGRFTPIEMRSQSTIRGRESRLDMLYDHDRGTVEYHSVTHTFFLGRRRQVDDLLKLPTDRAVDDLLSAELNLPPICSTGNRTAPIARTSCAAPGPKTKVRMMCRPAAIAPSSFRYVSR